MNATYPALEELPAYRSPAEELTEQLRRLQMLLERAVTRFREHTTPHDQRGLAGVAIFDDEIDALLAKVPQFGNAHDSAALTDARERCDLRAQASAAQGLLLPLETIRRRFDLGPIEFDSLLLCLAAELHPSYGRVFAYLNNDVTRTQPSVPLLVDILSENWAQRLEARRALSGDSIVFTASLLALRQTSEATLAELSVDPGLLAFVLGDTSMYQRHLPLEELALDELLVAPSEHDELVRIIALLVQDGITAVLPTVLVVSGAPGSGRRTVARTICREIGVRLYPVEGHVRDACLYEQVPWVHVTSGDERVDIGAAVRRICRLPVDLAILIVDSDDPPRVPRCRAANVRAVHLATPPASVRRTSWKRALRESGVRASDETIQSLAAVYPFSVGRIYAAVQDAHARHDDAAAASLGIRELAAAARAQTSHHLDALAQPLALRYSWDDIVLPDDERARLREIADAVRNRDRVMEQWGFGDKICTTPGVNAIFFGPSGTGKTMAASILAGELGMAIYRVDLSRVVSKYIGDTERNLDTLFEEARRSFALLFFDEAEAIFGKRSEVKDAHDRYANIEVAYLLQRMESFEGVAILATNLRKHLDNAFLRRLQFAVEFPLPGYAQRLQIWRGIWPEAATLDADVDLEYVANRFELSGGHIRNVAMMAAYLACEDGAPIGMRHLVAATRREFQKLGRGLRVGD